MFLYRGGLLKWQISAQQVLKNQILTSVFFLPYNLIGLRNPCQLGDKSDRSNPDT